MSRADLMGFPIKLHLMTPVMAGAANCMTGSAPYLRSILTTLLLSFSPQSVTTSVSLTGCCPPLHLSVSTSSYPPSLQQWPIPLSQLSACLHFSPNSGFISGPWHCYCLLIFKCCLITVFCWKLFNKCFKVKIKTSFSFSGVLIVQNAGFHKDIVTQLYSAPWPCLSYSNLLTTLILKFLMLHNLAPHEVHLWFLHLVMQKLEAF